MAKTCFILLIILVTISDFTTVKAKLCEKPSKTWFGVCKDPEKCDKQCIEWEGADHGSCHQREAKYMCFCYMQCGPSGKNPTPPKAGQPSPPGGTGKPSPPSGSQPSPLPPGGSKAGGGLPSSPPSGGGGQQPAPPSPETPGGGKPSPPDGGQSAPPPGCNTLYIEKLIAEALAKHNIQV